MKNNDGFPRELSKNSEKFQKIRENKRGFPRGINEKKWGISENSRGVIVKSRGLT